MKDHEPEIIRFRVRDIVLYGLAALVVSCLWLALSGCMDVAQWQLRTFYGVDCREDKLVNGRCVPVKKAVPAEQPAPPVKEADKK
jgi:hypothetical protein